MNKPAQTAIIKYDRRFLVLGKECCNSPDLCSPVWFSFRLKPTAWPTNWNQIQSQLACIDPYLTSRLGMDWYWLTIKPLAGLSRDLLNMLNEKVSYLCPSMREKRNSSTCKTTAEPGLGVGRHAADMAVRSLLVSLYVIQWHLAFLLWYLTQNGPRYIRAGPKHVLKEKCQGLLIAFLLHSLFLYY